MQVYDKTQVRPLTLNSISDEAHTCSSNACFCCFVVAKSVFTFASCFDRSVSYKNKPKVLIRQWAPCIQCQRHETNTNSLFLFLLFLLLLLFSFVVPLLNIHTLEPAKTQPTTKMEPVLTMLFVHSN